MLINIDKAFRRLDRLAEQRRGLSGVECRDIRGKEANIEYRLIRRLDELITQAAAAPAEPLNPDIVKIAARLDPDAEGDESGIASEYLRGRYEAMTNNLFSMQDAGYGIFGCGDGDIIDQLEHRIARWQQVSDRLAAA
jgi:hypothetical protein